MSNHLTSEVYKRQVGGLSRNAVLVLLADKASDDGSGIWASKSRMAAELGCTKQTVITIISGLIEDGLVKECGHRANANGYTVEYAIDVAALRRLPLVAHHADQSKDLTGQAAGPVKGTDPTGQAARPHRSKSLTQTPLNPSEPPRGSARARAGTAKGSEKGSGDRAPSGHRLPDDWTPPAVDDLPPMARNMVSQWPEGAFAASCEAFRLHWQNETGANALKRDWTAVLARWLMTDHPKVQRQAKAGISFEAAAPVKRTRGTTTKPVAARKREDQRSWAIRDELGQLLGLQVMEQWFGAVALIHTGDHLRVVCPSAFALDWLRDHHAQDIAKAVRAAGIDRRSDEVRFEIENTSKGGA